MIASLHLQTVHLYLHTTVPARHVCRTNLLITLVVRILRNIHCTITLILRTFLHGIMTLKTKQIIACIV